MGRGFRIVLILAACLLPGHLFSQSNVVKGKVINVDDKSPVVGANVVLINLKDTTKKHLAAAGLDGNFVLDGLDMAFYKIRITSVGFEKLEKFVRVNHAEVDAGKLALTPDTQMLDVLDIVSTVIPVQQKGDTTQFSADAYKANPDATVEDLIKKMPGLIVNGSGVQAQGENIQKVLVDGREFFGSDPTLALKSLPAEIVDKIEVFDQLSEQSQLTGFDDGNTTKTLNIVTRQTMSNGSFGRVYGGLGTNQLYNSGGNINFFNDDQRLTILGMANNVNQQNFSTEDILGVASGRQRRGGFGGGGGRRDGSGGGRSFGGGSAGTGNANDFMTGAQGGISTTQAFGLNFSDEIGTKFSVNGSYFFNRNDNVNNEDLFTETFSNAGSYFDDETALANSINQNHRLNLRMKYQINKSNSILFRPQISFQNNEATDIAFGLRKSEASVDLKDYTSNYVSNNEGFNISGSLLLQHAFEKRGRSLSLNLSSKLNDRQGESDLQSVENDFLRRSTSNLNQVTSSTTDGKTYSANLRMTEPLGNGMQLQASYQLSQSNEDYSGLVYDYNLGTELRILNDDFSNQFKSAYVTHSPGLSLMYRKDAWFTRIGANYQMATLEGDQVYPNQQTVNRKFNNVIPMVMARYRISRDKNLFFLYRTQTNAPSITQLQNGLSTTDQIQHSTGNPNLEQSNTNMLMTRFSNTNTEKSSTFFIFSMIRNTSNYVANSIYTFTSDSLLASGYQMDRFDQLSMPVNLDGYWNARNFVTYGFPVKFLKSNLNLNVGYTYSRNPGFVGGLENISSTHNINSGLVLSSNVNENVDFTVSYNLDNNRVENSSISDLQTTYRTETFGAKMVLTFWDGTVFRNEWNYLNNTGFGDDTLNEDYMLWNISLGKKVFKNKSGEFKFSVFDLLQQNRSIGRLNTETYIQETHSQVLTQYFMGTFTYTLRNFRGAKT